MTNARIPPLLRPRPPVNLYPPLLALDDRRLRLLAMWESVEALKLAAKAGLEVPMRNTDDLEDKQPWQPLGHPIPKPAPKPPEDREVVPGVRQGKDGRLYTEIPLPELKPCA